MQTTRCLQLIGLVVGFVGALLLTVSQRENRSGVDEVKANSIADAGRARGQKFIVLAHPWAWRVGLVVLCVGFAVQVVAEVLG